MLTKSEAYPVIRPQTTLDIITFNPYLEKALTLLGRKCVQTVLNLSEAPSGAWETSNIRLCLVDTDSLCGDRRRWLLITERILEADGCAFMGFTAHVNGPLAQLAIDRTLQEIESDLTELMSESEITWSLLTNDHLLSWLNHSERRVFVSLMLGMNARKASASLGISEKEVYRLRGQIMKKYGLKDRKELHRLMTISEFVQFYEHRKKRLWMMSYKAQDTIHPYAHVT